MTRVGELVHIFEWDAAGAVAQDVVSGTLRNRSYAVPTSLTATPSGDGFVWSAQVAGTTESGRTRTRAGAQIEAERAALRMASHSIKESELAAQAAKQEQEEDAA